jgi:hypothetical protein
MTTLALLALAVARPAAPVDPPIVAASLFKNGYAYVVRQTALPAGGELVLRMPETAVLGTFLIAGSPGVKIGEVTSTTVETESERNATNLDELLAWNVGRKVRLEATTVHSQQSWAVEGKLLSADGQFAVIEGNGMRNAVAKSSINRLVSFEGEFLVYSQKVKQIARVLRIRATGPTDGQIMVTAMQPGMSWVPAYRADITDDKKLKLVARATLFNELGNLDGIQAKLVVGFPNVAYLGVTEPLVSPAGLAQFLPSGTRAVRQAPRWAAVAAWRTRWLPGSPQATPTSLAPSNPGLRAASSWRTCSSTRCRTCGSRSASDRIWCSSRPRPSTSESSRWTSPTAQASMPAARTPGVAG